MKDTWKRAFSSLAMGVAAGLMASQGCIVPDIGDLPRGQCDAVHPCPSLYRCQVGYCEPDTGAPCATGTTLACGTDAGTCRPGVRQCVGGTLGVCEGEVVPGTEVCNGRDEDCNGVPDNGVPGGSLCGMTMGVCAGRRQACVDGGYEATCTAASYGPDYETTETRCDNRDNDCNGGVDVGLTQLCPLQEGVCAGAVVSCTGGLFPTCDTPVYASNDNRYEAVEVSCDTADNDCDGDADNWNASNVSGSGAVPSKHVASVGVRSNGTVLFYFEEGLEIRARNITPDGRPGTAVPPAVTVGAAKRSYSPVVATDGTVIAAAWADNIDPGDGGTTHRVMVATVNPNGVTNLANGSAYPIGFEGAATQSIAIAVDSGRIVVVVEAAVDGGTRTAIRMANLPAVLPPSAVTIRELTGPTESGKNPHISPGGGSFDIVWEDSDATNGIQLQTVDTTGATTTRMVRMGPPGSREPKAFRLASGTEVYFLKTVGASDVIARHNCNTGTSCPAGTDYPLATGTDMKNLMMVSDGIQRPPAAAAWDDTTGMHMVLGATPRKRDFSGLNRPSMTYMNVAAERRLILLSDSGLVGTSLPTDEIFWHPFCY